MLIMMSKTSVSKASMNKYSEFLKEVDSMNNKYASIYVNCELEPLSMPFWSWQVIQKGLDLREEWEVDVSLTPFYGDWHDLFCLKESTGEIIALNDNREAVCTWASVNDFVSSLSEQEIKFDGEQHAFGESISTELH